MGSNTIWKFIKNHYGKLFLTGILLYCLIALSTNFIHYFALQKENRAFNQGWYHYQSATLYTDQDILPNLIKSIKPNDSLYISMFLWPLDVKTAKPVPPYDIEFAKYLYTQRTRGDVYVDSINFQYKLYPQKIATNPVMQAAPNLHWYILTQPNAIPNNILIWPIHTPALQNILNRYAPIAIIGTYLGLKVSSNHQKVVVINQGADGAWIGSRNFNRANWNNQDHFLFIKGDIAKIMLETAEETVARLNPRLKSRVTRSPDITPISIEDTNHTNHLARLVNAAELKPILLYLISQSNKIDIEISLLSDNDMIAALNHFLHEQGRLRIILDPNRYIFKFKLPFMPNVVPITDLDSKAQVRLQQTEFQMHTKSALFTLKNGAICYFNSTANWSVGALERLSYNDLGIIVCNDDNVTNEFNANFAKNWAHALPRENITIENKDKKYWLTQLMSFIGFNPW